MTTLQVICAYSGAQETFDRHLPIWKANVADTIVVCPQGSGINPRRMDQYYVGLKGHNGAVAMQRYLNLLTLLGSREFCACELIVIQDYDSLCLSADIPIPEHPIAGVLKRSNDLKTKFKGDFYIHPPNMFTREGLELVLKHAPQLPPESEGGFFDRWIGYLCQLNNIPVTDWNAVGLGYSRNTIDDAHLKEACDYARKGCVMFHGVKTEECLNAIQEARKEYLRAA